MASIKASEVSNLLQMELEGFSDKLKFEETGKVLQISDGVARVFGLTKVQSNEPCYTTLS